MKTIGNVLLIIALIGVGAGILIPTTSGGVSKEVARTRSATIKIMIGCYLYRDAYGAWPPFSDASSLARALNEGNEKGLRFVSLEDDILDRYGNFIDGWRHHFQITNETGELIQFRSSGKDGRFGTKDDLIYTEKIQNKETEPNKAMEPTPVNVTAPASAGPAPFTSVAHLDR